MSKKKKNRIPEGPEKPFCPHFEECGGCTYQRFSYEGQLQEKLAKVSRLMEEACSRFSEESIPDGEAGSEIGTGEYPIPFPLYEAYGSPRQTGYRNKMEFSFGDREKDGPLTLGLHQRGSFYNVIPIYECQIVDSDYRAILWMTLDFFRKKGIPYVHKRTHEGVLRHLLVRKSVAAGEILVALVTSSKALSTAENGGSDEPEWMDEYRERLQLLDLYGSVTGLLHIINDSPADVVRSDRTVVVFGRDYFYEELLGMRFKITPFSFFQTNSTGAEVLYSVVRDYIGDVSGLTVYDLYSGTGTIAQLLAPVAERVVGVEIVEEAVQAAVENAAMNGLTNCEFIAGDVLAVLDELPKPDVMVLDPPREGIHPKALPKLMDYGVEHFVYVSCKPESLARDMEVILASGYRPVKSVCVDMFPWTKHIETVCLFSKTEEE